MLNTIVKRIVVDTLGKLLLSTVTYVLLLGGGMVILLLVSSAIGYLPYSDRPGPGWYGGHLPTWEEARFFGNWAIFLVGPNALVFGTLLSLYSRTLEWLRTPRWCLRVLCGTFSGFGTLVLVAGAGWYITISAAAVYGGMLLGLTFGAVVLPQFAKVPDNTQRPWWRWAGMVLATAMFAGLVVYPYLPDPDAQTLDYHFVRLVPGPEEIASGNSTGLTEDQAEVLRSLRLTGLLHGGLQGNLGSSGDKHARALIVVLGPVQHKVSLRQPKAVSVVFIQDGDTWRIYPEDAPLLRKRISFMEMDGEFEGLSTEIEPVIGGPSEFTWFPPIRRNGR